MNTTKNTYFNVVAVGLLALSAATYNIQSTPVNLSLLAGSSRTLGSLLASTIQGHTSFHFPNTPQFRHFYDFTAPRKYNAFYTTDTGKITLGGFVRFTERGHSLFDNINDRKAYKKALSNAVWAHKNYQARPSAKRKAELIAAEDHVHSLLNKVLLTHDNCKQLEKILSKSPTTGFSWLSLLFPWRAGIEVSQLGQEVTINRGHILTEPFRMCGRSLLYSLYAVALVGGANAVLFSTTPAAYIKLPREIAAASLLLGAGSYALCSLGSLILSFTNYNLAPEPNEGVKVAIHAGFNPLARLIPTTAPVVPVAENTSANADEHRVLRIAARGLGNDLVVADEKNKRHTK